jgi:dTDP-4-amino-4,6-dideoxygalactose transaminase
LSDCQVAKLIDNSNIVLENSIFIHVYYRTNVYNEINISVSKSDKIFDYMEVNMSKLAVNGGMPLRTKKIPMWPVYDEKESHALDRVLKSGIWGTLGSEVKKFTERFAKYQHCNYGVAVTNGTVTLEIILRALDIGFEDEVIIPPYTFNATASAVIISGATPVFVDIESNTYNIDPEKIEEAISPRTKAIIPVHIGGRPCNMDRIMEIAEKHGLYVIEDAAHAHGSEWKGKRVGSIGHASSFSFQASKNLCAGEGGFIATNNQAIFEQCWSVHHCGRKLKDTQWYDHPIVGTNARMTEWQAAILDAQMDRLDAQIERRMKNAAYLSSRLSEINFIEVFPEDENVTRNSYHLYVFKYLSEKCKGLSRESFIKALLAEGIPCAAGYRCLYKQGMLKSDTMKRLTGSKIVYDEIYLENTEVAAEKEGMWFPHFMLLGDREDIDDIADAMIKIYENVDELL